MIACLKLIQKMSRVFLYISEGMHLIQNRKAYCKSFIKGTTLLMLNIKDLQPMHFWYGTKLTVSICQGSIKKINLTVIHHDQKT